MFGNTRLLTPEVQKLNLSHPGFKPKACPLRERAANRLSQSEVRRRRPETHYIGMANDSQESANTYEPIC